MPLEDDFGRKVTGTRVSLTDRAIVGSGNRSPIRSPGDAPVTGRAVESNVYGHDTGS